MERTSEPELMENADQVNSYAKADFSEGEINLINQISYYLLKNDIYLGENDLIVDLGCGPGNISEKLSIKWPKAKVVGIDGSKEMICKAEFNKNEKLKGSKFRNLSYICADIKNVELSEIVLKKEINLLVSNSLIHHITNLEEFFNCIKRLSSNRTINFHKDLKRPINEELALELKEICSNKYDDILTNDYYSSLKASYTFKEINNFLLENKLSSLNVFEEGNQYLVIYGKV